MRLTKNEVAEELKNRTRTKEEEIYLKLAFFESECEKNRLYTKRDLNNCITKSMETLANIIRDKLTSEIVQVMVNELEKLSVEGKVPMEEVKRIGEEVIKVVKNDQVRSEG